MRLRVALLIIVISCTLCVLPAIVTGLVDETPAAPALAGEVNATPSGCTTGNLVLPRMDGPRPLGSSRFYREIIPPGTSRSWVDLAWNPDPGPYTLYVYSPDTVLGPYGNSANGVLDGRIFLEIAADSNLTPGSWYYQVRGNGNPPCNGYSFRTWLNTGPGGA